MNSTYGIIKGKISKYETENQSVNEVLGNKKSTPHYNFMLNCGGKIYNANINVLSRNIESPDLKVYFSNNPENDLKNLGALNEIKLLNDGVYNNLEQKFCIDYLRGDYIDLTQLKVLIKDKFSEEMFLYQMIDEQIRSAKENNYNICAWGNLYENTFSYKDSEFGIHDIHMNQGNLETKDNSIWNDGLFAIYDGDKLKFVCFLAFSGQCMKTDDNGNCQS